MQNGEGVYLSPRQVLGLYLSQGGKCLYCKQELLPENLTVEHVICRFWGGPAHAFWNLALACETCNKLKGVLEGGLNTVVMNGTFLDKIQACLQDMIDEAGKSPAVHNMVEEIRERIQQLEKYEHSHVPPAERETVASELPAKIVKGGS
jgi:hypothetical protein